MNGKTDNEQRPCRMCGGLLQRDQWGNWHCPDTSDEHNDVEVELDRRYTEAAIRNMSPSDSRPLPNDADAIAWMADRVSDGVWDGKRQEAWHLYLAARGRTHDER